MSAVSLAISMALIPAIAAVLVAFQQCRSTRADLESQHWQDHIDRLHAYIDHQHEVIAGRPTPRLPVAPEPWTPSERAAFGIDDTDAFIAELDRALHA